MLFLAEDAESERDLQRADFRIMPEGAAKSLPKLKGAEAEGGKVRGNIVHGWLLI